MMLASVDDIYDFGEDFLNEDCFDVDLDCDFFEAISHLARVVSSDSGSESGHAVLPDSSSKAVVRKSKMSKSKMSKLGSKIPKISTAQAGDVNVKNPVQSVPQASRRPPSMKLYVYPSFDKSDSSLFLPSRLAKHLNSGNMSSVSKLIQLHFDKNCKIAIDFMNTSNINPRGLVKWYGFVQDLHADSIMCVRQTIVTENQIKSMVYIKFTDVRAVADSVRGRVKDPALKRILESEKERPGTRANPFRKEDYSEEEYEKLDAIHRSSEDKIVYLTQEMTLTVDNLTCKVTGFSLQNRLTKLAIAPPCSNDEEV